MRLNKKTVLAGAVLAAAALIISTGLYFAKSSGNPPTSEPRAGESDAKQADALRAKSVELNETQVQSVKVEPAGEQTFVVQREAVGSIDFNEDMTVQVFSPYQGKIAGLFAKLGDEVVKGRKLYTIDSPDLGQAESILIAAAGVLELTTRTLARAKKLYETQGISRKDLEQAVSDQQSAEGALKAARNAVRLFGKTEAEIDQIVAKRKIDPIMVVPSPITGRITARNAAPGLLVQPGAVPAPYSVADVSTMWMLAYVMESDSPLFHPGQEVKVKVMAYADKVFEGKVSTIGAAVDPATHRLLVRSEILDPKHELRPGMFATFVIRTGDSVRATAVPAGGVVREGDGTMTVWVTTDNRTFVKRSVKVGLQQDGYDQIVAGLQPGESVATEGALFLSNALINATR
ncbi:MAG: efflux RND transporter periplasmic adaptor subunit [Syntrophobacteraceae bacterium]|jgi:cobalt-zinc-cadmium efflux system membrane fusion protein